MVTGKTGICGLVGNQIDHSLSPQIHNTAFARLNLDYIYIPFRVQKGDLKNAVNGLRAIGVRGFNVTMPYKTEVIQYVDELDPLAEKIGAVNTVVNTNGKLVGFNTDASGFLNAFLENGINPDGKNVVVLGSGGAARAILFILMQQGASVTIVNRTIIKAEEVAADLSREFGLKPNILGLNKDAIAMAVKSADILVNTTSVGMDPDRDSTLIDALWIRPGMVVSDIVYIPIKTRLLKNAEQAGAVTVNGIEMIIHQAALSFELWTGVKSPVDIIRAEINKV
jgi:shikimate dehydrogenase